MRKKGFFNIYFRAQNIYSYVQMQVMGGIEAIRQIRTTHPDIPILAATAHAMKEDQQHCLAAGMNGYVYTL